MKIIDKTPLHDEKGQLSFINRIQGMLKYGLSWPANLEAQRKVMAVLNKTLEKGYTLVRNQKLGASDIIVPLVLFGPAGIHLIEVTPLKGFYRARGDEWGSVIGDVFQPDPINILKRTEQLGKVLQKYYEKMGVKLAAPIEAALIATDPGMNIESVRPVVRVVMSDAIERFATSLLGSRPVYNAAVANDLVDRLLEPRSANKPQPEPPAANDPFALDETPFPGQESEPEPSRMQSILNAPKSDALIDTGRADIGFAFAEDEAAASSKAPTIMVKSPPEGAEFPAPKSNRPRRILGLTVFQLAILGFMMLVWCFIMVLGIFWFIPYIQQAQ